METTMTNRMRTGLVIAILTLGAMPAADAQSQRAASSDASTALLEEVRALRAELAQLTRTGLRMQLLMARVQLQEQRILYFDRQRAELHSQVTAASERAAAAATEIERIQDQIKSLSSASSTPTGPGQVAPPDVAQAMRQAMRPALELALEGSRKDAAAASKAEQQLRAQEAEVLANLASEQSRWNEFNARLDELERSLPTR
jgi:hypothetical protein